ncbi:MAG: hypothetical protein Q9216_004264 [Gyalolechia sp. 2 TL-2023]
MPIQQHLALEASSFPPDNHQDIYELQDVTGSPTRRSPQRIRHFHASEDASDEAEKTVLEHIDSDSDQASSSQHFLHYTPSEEKAVVRTEAAFSPGVPVFLASFYKRDELAYRIGLFISAAPLATSFASSLAWLITRLGQKSPIASWRMLFLVEGFPSVLISVLAYYYIPNRPGVAKYLTKRERRVAELRLQARKRKDQQHEARPRKLEWTEIWEALRDPKCYLTA